MNLEEKKIKKHYLLAVAITFLETLILITFVVRLTENPLWIIFNPSKIWEKNLSPRNFMLILSGVAYMVTKYLILRNMCSLPATFLFFLVSHIAFVGYFFENTTNHRHILGFCFPNNVCCGYSLISIVISSLYNTYNCFVLRTGPVYTRFKGLFNFFNNQKEDILKRSVRAYTSNYLISLIAVEAYFICLAPLFSMISDVFPCFKSSESTLSVTKSMLLINLSGFAYFLVTAIIDKLIVYNNSILSMEYEDFTYEKNEDIEFSRFKFYQISEISKLDRNTVLKIARSRAAISAIEDYIKCENIQIRKIIDDIKNEKKSLEGKIWLNVPQVTEHNDKPSGFNLPKKHGFIKKVRSYNIIEIITGKLLYLWKVAILMSKLKSSIRSFEQLNDTFKFLKKYHEDYLLIKDLDDSYNRTVKNLYDYIIAAEDLTGMFLFSKLFQVQ